MFTTQNHAQWHTGSHLYTAFLDNFTLKYAMSNFLYFKIFLRHALGSYRYFACMFAALHTPTWTYVNKATQRN